MEKRLGRAVGCFLLVLASAVLPPPSFADSSNKYWLLYEQGRTAADQKEYGKALQLYKSAIEGAGIFPEAEAAIGDIFLAESEPSLAQRQYEKAYELRKSFYIPENQYDILYKLANLFEMQQQYRQMEDGLLKIVSDDKRFQETPNQRLRSQIEKNYFDKGIDRVLVLYSFDIDFAAAAHSRLGWFYYRTGRFSQSVSHLLYAVIYRMTQSEQWLKDRDVDFQFTSLADLVSSLDSNTELKAFAASSGVFRDLYYLAGATFSAGYPRHAAAIWNILSTAATAGQYKALAERQLKKPFTEPLLTIVR
jgi:hypothetical protein